MVVILETFAFIAFGLWAIADGYRIEQHVRRPGMFDAIGPDHYIMVLGGLLIALAAGYLLAERRGQMVPPTAGKTEVGSSTVMPSRITVELFFAFAAYALVIPLTGYVLATAIFFVISYWIMGVRSLVALGTAALLSAVSFAVIFIGFSEMPLPRGTLGLPH